MIISNKKPAFLALIFLIGALGIFFYSCEKEVITQLSPEEDNNRLNPKGVDLTFSTPENICGKVSYSPIVNWQGKEVGDAYSYNDGSFFYIHLIARVDFRIKDAQLHVSPNQSGIPLDQFGNPDYLQFQHSITGLPEDQKRVFKIPVSSLQNLMYVTTSAEIRNINVDENPYFRTWVEGIEYGNTATGHYFKYKKGTCPLVQPATELGD